MTKNAEVCPHGLHPWACINCLNDEVERLRNEVEKLCKELVELRGKLHEAELDLDAERWSREEGSSS